MIKLDTKILQFVFFDKTKKTKKDRNRCEELSSNLFLSSLFLRPLVFFSLYIIAFLITST